MRTKGIHSSSAFPEIKDAHSWAVTAAAPRGLIDAAAGKGYLQLSVKHTAGVLGAAPMGS